MISLKSLMSEDYPSEFSMEKFNSVNSYRGKVAYVQSLLKRISSGSSRIVYQIDDIKVMKLARNKKGLAQNRVESDYAANNYEITAKVFECDRENYFWVEMELAKKVSPTRFKALTEFTIQEFDHLMRQLNGRMTSFYSSPLSPNLKSRMENSEFYGEVEHFVADYDINPMDFTKLSSFGEVIRNGKPRIVIIDYGLTREVFKSHYSEQ